jgi:hypothetical protein
MDGMDGQLKSKGKATKIKETILNFRPRTTMSKKLYKDFKDFKVVFNQMFKFTTHVIFEQIPKSTRT